MVTMSYLATIECDGVICDSPEVEMTLPQGGGIRDGQGEFSVPSNLTGVIMTASTHATVRASGSDEFKILTPHERFPECAAGFATCGAGPEDRRVA